MGRALLCAPYFSTCVLAANTLLLAGDDAAKEQYLPGLASGERSRTLALSEEDGRWDEPGVTLQAAAAAATAGRSPAPRCSCSTATSPT